MLAPTRSVLKGLIDIFFSGSPEESVGAAIKLAVDHVGGDKVWEQIYIDSLQAAVKEDWLKHYVGPDGEIGLDVDRVKHAFQADLSIRDKAGSDLQDPAFVDNLINRLVELEALYIGGSELTRDETRRVVETVVKVTAPAHFWQFVQRDESAFRQALTREATNNGIRLASIDAFLNAHHAAVIDRLAGIDVKIDDLPRRVADEIAARAGREPAAKPKPRRVFISYARKDHADEGRDPDSFVQKLYRALKAAGFTPFLDHHDMPSRGTSFPKEIRDAVQQSEQFIAVCGPAYPTSEWARAERDHAHATCISIVPVLAAGEFETEVPKDIALLNGIDMRGDFDARWPELLKRIEPLAPIPGKVIALAGVMPEYNERNIPRTALFEQIDAALRKDQTDPVAIAGTRALTAMYAAGGIGKTTLAAQVARDCSIRRGFPDGVVWMHLGETDRDPDALRIRLGGLFGMPEEALTGANGAANFVLRLQELDALIVLDDVWSKDQVRACRVDGPNLRYLITTRLANLPNDLNLPDDNRIKVGYLTLDEGVELIARRHGLDPTADYPHKSVHRDIVETLEGHTHAIDLVIRYLRPRDQGGSGPDYAPTLLAQLRKDDNTLFELLMRSIDDESREGNLLKSLSVSYEMLPTTPIDFQRLFRLLAVFAPGGSFDHVAAAAVWDMDDPERARRLLNELVGRSLITPTEDLDRYTIHALIHAAARVLLAEDPEAYAAARRHAAHYAAQLKAHDNAGTYHRMKPNVAQLKHAFVWAKEHDDLDLMLSLVANAANLLHQFGYSRERLDWADACVRLARAQNDLNKTGQALASRGNAYLALTTVDGEDRRARLYAARADYDEALELRCDVPLEKAETMANRAVVYHELSTVDGEDRRAWLVRALADNVIAYEYLRDVSLDKAALLNNRAAIFNDLSMMDGEDRHSRLLQALAALDEALVLRRDMPLDKAMTLNNRALVLDRLSKLDGENRRERLLQILADLDEALAIGHYVPLTKAHILNNRANAYCDLATVDGEDRRMRLYEALADHDAALELRRDVPLEKATTLNNRANVYRDLSTIDGEDRRTRLYQSLVDFNEAIVILRYVPLAKASTLTNRAVVYHALSTTNTEDRRYRLLQALADYDEAVALQADAPLDRGSTLNNRATVYSDLSTIDGEDRRTRLYQALADHDIALELRRKSPLDKATTLHNRATAYFEVSTIFGEDRRARLYQAMADYNKALELRRNVPLDKASTLNNRANVFVDLSIAESESRRPRLLQALADYDEALTHLRGVPLDRSNTLGNRATVHSELSMVDGEDRHRRLLQALADYDEALIHLRDVPLDRANALNNRATVCCELSKVTGEHRRERLHQALADADEALALRHDAPLQLAETLNNRAVFYRELSTEMGEDRRGRLKQALDDAVHAHTIFTSHGHEVSLPVVQNVLRSVARHIAASEGFSALEVWWSVITRRQPLPEWLRPPPDVSLTKQDADRIVQFLAAWVQTPDWAASKAFLYEHETDLLTDTVDAVLWALIDQESDSHIFEQCRALLRRAREGGIDVAYASLLDLQPPDTSLTQEEFESLANLLIEWVRIPDRSTSRVFLVEHKSDLLTDAADYVLWAFIQQNLGWTELEQHRSLLRAAREVGIDAAYEQLQ